MTREPQEIPSNDPRQRAVPLEMSILSTLLSSPGSLKDVKGSLTPDNFLSKSAQQLYKWILRCDSDGTQATVPVAMATFTEGQAQTYLWEVLSAVPDELTLTANASHLKDIAVRYNSIQLLQKGLLDLMRNELPATVTLGSISKAMQDTQYAYSGAKSNLRTIAEIGYEWREDQQRKQLGEELKGIVTGFRDLDNRIIRMLPGELYIIGGRPAMGKTTFAMNIAENVAVAQASSDKPKVILIYSLEMKDHAIYNRMVASLGTILSRNLKTGLLEIGEVEKLSVATSKIDNLKIFIDDTPQQSLDQMAADAQRLINEGYEIAGIFIDYLQLMKIRPEYAGNPNQGVGENSKGLKVLAKNADCPVVALSQLNRGLEQRANKRPVAADLRESGNIEQDADAILFVYRDEVYHPDTEFKGIAEIISAKLREGEVGTDYVGFEGKYSRFVNLDEGLSLDGVRDHAAERSKELSSMMGPTADEESGVPFDRLPAKPLSVESLLQHEQPDFPL